MEPSQLGSLKGLNGTRNTRIILVRPLTVKVKAYVQFEVVLIRVTITRELNCYARFSMRLFSAFNCCRVVPLYREVDAQRFSESRPAHNSVRLGLLTILALHYKPCHNDGLSLRALSLVFCSTLAALVSVIPVLCSLILRSLRGWVLWEPLDSSL